MTEFDAIYYDGQTAARNPVRVRAYGDRLQVVGEGVELQVPLGEVRADAPIASGPRSLALPGGAQLRTSHPAASALFPGQARLETLVHGLEQRWPYALAGLLVVAAFAWWFVVRGLPLAAEAIAGQIPISADAALGAQALAAIDARWCRPTRMDPQAAERLHAQFRELTAGLDDGHGYRLHLRQCAAIGPNAFALPGGNIVLTDQLVQLSRNPYEVTAVLAHEAGHVRLRHGLRTMLQGAGLMALISALAGDAAAMTSIAVTLPTVLLQSGYSREFELQADDFAFSRMREIGISPRTFADFLRRIENERAGKPDHGREYFSTHPLTSERIERALANETDLDRCTYAEYGDDARLEHCNRSLAAGSLAPKELAAAYATRGLLHMRRGSDGAAVADFSKALESGSRSAQVHNALAWTLATSPIDAARDGARAVRVARTACELSGWNEPGIIDTLAAAHAEAGQFDEAVRWQRKALGFPAFERAHGSEARERLALYQARLPYRQRAR